MSQFRRSVAAIATLAAVAALPATASAKDNTAASKASVATVQSNAANAQQATKRLKRAVRQDQSSVARRQLRIARSQTAAASRGARQLARSADTRSESVAAARALTVAGTQDDVLLETLTALVDEGPAQRQIAGSIQPTIIDKARIIAILTSLLDDVPESVRPILAAIITALAAGDATEVVNLDNAIDGGTLPAGILGIVSQALAIATQAIQSALGLIESSVLPALPTEAQAPVGGILGIVTSITGTLIPGVLSTVTGLLDSILGSLPFVGGGSGGGGLFGGLLGNLLGGGESNAGGIGALISNLLGSVFGGADIGGSPGDPGTGTGTTPAGGISGIIATILNLITSLLGSIFGGGGGVVPAS